MWLWQHYNSNISKIKKWENQKKNILKLKIEIDRIDRTELSDEFIDDED